MAKKATEKLIHALVFSRLDYCNGVFTGLNKTSINQLLKMDHITSILNSLHWPTVCKKIDFRILLMVYKA